MSQKKIFDFWVADKKLVNSSGVSLDEAAPGPTGIGCPQGRGMIDFFEVPWSFDNMNILLVVYKPILMDFLN